MHMNTYAYFNALISNDFFCGMFVEIMTQDHLLQYFIEWYA